MKYGVLDELYKLKALASSLEDKIEKANISLDEDGTHVFCLTYMLQERIDALITRVAPKGGMGYEI